MLGFKGHRVFLATLGLLALAAGVYLCLHWRSRNNAEILLEEADHLAWNNQWLMADPLYQRAETRFRAQGRSSEALYAHVSRFVVRAESEPLPGLLLELENDEHLPAARSGETELRILLIEGMIETNYDAGMARKTWERIESIALRRGHYLLAARAVGEQGIAAFLMGDVASASRLVRIAWIAARCFHDQPAHVRYASVYGAGLVELEQYGIALRVLNEAIDTAENSRGVAYPSIAIDSKIDALRGLHRYSEALAQADEAIRRLPSITLDAHLYQILTAKGKVYEDLGQWDEAATVYVRALSYARPLQYWRGIAETGGLLAQTLEHEGKLENALTTINEAIHANEQQPDELYFVPRNLAIKAEILDRLRRTQEAHSLYEKSLTLIDSLVATAPTPEVERELLTQLGVVYTSYFHSLSSTGDLAGAFAAVEKERGRVEAQALDDHPLVLPHEPSAIEQRIAALDVKLLETNDPQAKDQLQQALRDANLASDDSMMASRAARSPLSLQAVQQHLAPDELLLEYVLAEPISSVLAITRHTAQRYDLPSRSEIEGSARQYEAELRHRQTDPGLGSRLFRQILAHVPEYETHASVIVIPDGSLHLLPFAALMDGNSYAVTTHAISTSPSATVLSLLRDRERATFQDPLAYIGVAAWSEEEDAANSMRPASINLPRPYFKLLPESKQEVEEIASDFPKSSTLLLGPNATETKFKGLPLADYRVLHLALHGYANLEYPDRSALVFAPEEQGPDDGRLEVREIRNLRLKARLVALSACNTGVGPIGSSDIANIGNAFIEAGAETVVASLWELQDRTTERLMTDFYTKLTRDQHKAAALRDAQLDMIQAGLPPYYWAGFEVSGDPSGTL